MCGDEEVRAKLLELKHKHDASSCAQAASASLPPLPERLAGQECPPSRQALRPTSVGWAQGFVPAEVSWQPRVPAQAESAGKAMSSTTLSLRP